MGNPFMFRFMRQTPSRPAGEGPGSHFPAQTVIQPAHKSGRSLYDTFKGLYTDTAARLRYQTSRLCAYQDNYPLLVRSGSLIIIMRLWTFITSVKQVKSNNVFVQDDRGHVCQVMWWARCLESIEPVLWNESLTVNFSIFNVCQLKLLRKTQGSCA